MSNDTSAQTLSIVDSCYRSDIAFPEYMPLWREGWKWTDANGERVRYAYEGMPLGGYVHVYVQNPSTRPLDIKDIYLNGVSLTEGVARGKEVRGKKDKYASSIFFSRLPTEKIDLLIAAGEPVWWKIDPVPIPAGGMAELTIRLRRNPRLKRLNIELLADEKTARCEIRVSKACPRILSVSFSPELDRAFLYLQHPGAGAAVPNKIFFDGKDVTGNVSIHSDQKLDIVPVIVQLPERVGEPSFHCFQALYPDGLATTTSIRVWEPEFRYGMWGIPKEGNTADERAQIYLRRLNAHNINTVMSHYGGDVRKYVSSEEGDKLCKDLGMRIMDHSYGCFKDPLYYYLPDEPDAHDFGSKSIDRPDKRLGSLGQWIVELSKEYRRKDPDTLLLCNVDNTYKPEQWYMYAQLPDVISADPYYPEQLRSVYRYDPTMLGAYTKPTYVYATGKIYQSAGAPKPMHLILHSCRFDMEEYPFRAPTPEEKRIEVYYALAAGAKGISYWWYTPSKGKYYGCGGKAPEMVALMTEIGLLGAEVRTAGAVIARSCPVNLAVKAPRKLWIRTLVAGFDTVTIVVVNDDIACDRSGITVKPVEKTRLGVELPQWLQGRDAFEITYEGIRDINWQPIDQQVSIDLGKVEVTRLIMITSDKQLRSQLQKEYNSRFASKVRGLLASRKEARRETE
ncbi:MAG: hypothetical protein ACYTF1_14680 [Planctomycetota bacterium]